MGCRRALVFIAVSARTELCDVQTSLDSIARKGAAGERVEHSRGCIGIHGVNLRHRLGYLRGKRSLSLAKRVILREQRRDILLRPAGDHVWAGKPRQQVFPAAEALGFNIKRGAPV